MSPDHMRMVRRKMKLAALRSRDEGDSRPVEQLWAELSMHDRALLCDRLNDQLRELEKFERSAVLHMTLTDVLISLEDLEA